MVRIRLRRQGLKRQPIYRVVVTDQRKSRNGGFLEVIGHYNPRTRPATEVLDEERALYWLSVGAQPTEAVETIMKHTGTWERFQRLRKGEDMAALVEEAQAAAAEQEPISPRTAYPAPAPGKGSGPRQAERAAALAEAAEETTEAEE